MKVASDETKLRPGECPECRAQPWEYITVDEDHPEPEPMLCDVCGQPRRRFITVMYVDDLEDEGRMVAGERRRVDYRECVKPLCPPEVTFTLTLDNPNDAGVRSVMPVQARDMLREVGL